MKRNNQFDWLINIDRIHFTILAEWIKIPATCVGASSNFDDGSWHCSKALDGRYGTTYRQFQSEI